MTEAGATGVTVVMATYNRERYLQIAIESVLRQTYANFELIVIDDGSTDSTPEALARFARRDRRVVPLRQLNSGVSTARNRALALARQPLVAMADDDDFMHPHRLAHQVAYLKEHPGKCAVFTYARIVDADGAEIGRSAPEADFQRARRLRRPDLALDIIHGTSMLRRDVALRVGGYRLPALEDRDLIARLWTAGEDVGTIPLYLYSVRRHGSNVSRNFSVETLLYGDFVDHNALLRLDGLPEIGFEDYRSQLRSEPMARRFRRAVAQRARFAYDMATLKYAQRRLAATVGYALAAASLDPPWVARKVARKFVWRS